MGNQLVEKTEELSSMITHGKMYPQAQHHHPKWDMPTWHLSALKGFFPPTESPTPTSNPSHVARCSTSPVSSCVIHSIGQPPRGEAHQITTFFDTGYSSRSRSRKEVTEILLDGERTT